MKVISYALRFLVSPFILILILTRFVYEAIKRTILFIRYGGEFINYDSATNPRTIADVYNKIQESDWRDEMNFSTELYKPIEKL